MARPSIVLEAFDPATGWPVAIYPSYLAAEAAGHKRANISCVIRRKHRSHHGLGWRTADNSSRLAEFTALHCEEWPGCSIPVGQYVQRYAAWAGVGHSIDLDALIRGRLAKRYGVVPVEQYNERHAGAIRYSVDVVKDLSWRERIA